MTLRTLSILATPIIPRFRNVPWHGSILVIVCLVSLGCRKQLPQAEAQLERPATVAQPSGNRESAAIPAATSFPQEFTDGLGRKVTLSALPQRIVSLSPKNTEMLFAVGAGGQTVGVTTYCNYPPAAAAIDKIGGFSSKSISLERIVSLKPDLVISVGELHAPVIQELERLGLPVIAFAAESFAGLYQDLELLGRITGHENEAAALVGELNVRVNRIKQTAARIPASERLTVFYYAWGEPLTGAGPTSYLGEMVQFCGGVNITEDTSTRFPKLTMEVLVARNPDVIISSTNHSDLITPEKVQSRPGYSGLKAVQAKRVHLLDGGLVSRLTPRTVDAMELMAQAIYPTYFPARVDDSATRDDANGANP